MRLRHELTYWIAQLLGWGFYTGLMAFMLYTFNEGGLNNQMIILQFVIGGSCLLTTHVNRILINRWDWKSLPILKLLPRVLLINISAAIVSQILIHTSMITWMQWSWERIIWSNIPAYTLNLFMMITVWSLFYFGYNATVQSRRATVGKLKAESALKEAELIALKAQINPHFLFNALNNIRAMILEDQMKARDMVSNLSDMLRYSVDFSNQEKVALRDELDIVKNYLQLEMVHYDNRLEYKLEIAENTTDQMIPPMLIQLLVENAVKHGISKLPKGGEIKVKTKLEGDDLLITVENTGELTDNERKGIGIKNALDRIRILFDVDPNFDLSQKDQNVVATLRLLQCHEYSNCR